jgi:hypothetical protein
MHDCLFDLDSDDDSLNAGCPESLQGHGTISQSYPAHEASNIADKGACATFIPASNDISWSPLHERHGDFGVDCCVMVHLLLGVIGCFGFFPVRSSVLRSFRNLFSSK